MEVVQQFLAVLLVFGLLGLAVWKLRGGGAMPMLGGRSQGRTLQSIERIELTPQHAMHLVKVHGHEVVVMTHPHGCSLLQGPGARDQAPEGREL